MALSSGTRLGFYEILSSLGEGGMGAVYRARDTKLGRTVAVKVLHDAVASDPERIARFEREAKMLASLNHPNIAALYGLEESDARHLLVMELVEGETLAARLDRGALANREALDVAMQIAEALETAHEQGVIHRDLKPANVKITPEGKVKVLDFGLAKAMDAPQAASNVTNSPTLSMMATQAGIILGTAAYMSPEQAKGAPADQRSDIFSFGVVLYEMLVGRPPFAGDTAPEVMANVLVRDADLALLPSSTHHRLRDLLRRCLEKHPKKRWQAIGDVRAELESIAEAPEASAETPREPSMSPGRLAALLAATVLATAAVSGYAAWRFKPPPHEPIIRFSIPLEGAERLVNQTSRRRIAVSPDGSQLAMVVTRGTGALLAVRAVDALDYRVLPGTEHSSTVSSPAFSPDGEWLAFWANSALRKVPIHGGSPVTLAQLSDNPISLAWNHGWLVFSVAGSNGGIYRVSESGGEPEKIVPVDPPLQANGASLIDNGSAVLYARSTSEDLDRWDKADIVVHRPGSSEGTVVLRGGSDPTLVASGHLVYAAGAALLAVPFDQATARTSGAPVPVLEGVARVAGFGSTGSGVAHYAVSTNGLLAYVPGTTMSASTQLTLALVSRDGAVEQLPLQPRPMGLPRVSPDGKRVAFAVNDGRESQVWIYLIGAAAPARRLTFGGSNTAPVWTPDGRYITFQSNRDGSPGIYWQLADGSGTAEVLTRADSGTSHVPESWSPDGKTLLYTVISSGTGTLWTISTTGDRTPKTFASVEKGRIQAVPSFSPDGRWVAYGSNQLGGSAFFVFVEPFPPTGAKYQATTTATSTPVWSRDGRQLFFAFANRVFVADVRTTPEFQVGQPTALNSEESLPSGPTLRNFDVMPDGRLLVTIPPGATTATRQTSQVNVVVNWFQELRAKMPVR